MGTKDPGELGPAILRAMDGVSLGVTAVIVDESGKIERVYTNQAAADLLGYPIDEIEQSQPLMTVAPDHRPRFNALAARFASGGQVPPLLETVIQAKDGRRFPIQVGMCHGSFDGKRLTVAFLQDLSERVRVQEALAMSEARFRQFAEAAPDAIIVIVDGRLAYANPATARIFGFDHVDELRADEPDRVEWAELLTLVARGIHLPPRDYRSRRKDGTSVDIEISSIAIEFEGRPAILAFGRDVSERKRMQADLLRADRMAMIGTLAAGVAHEINNPLAYVLLHLRRLNQRLPALIASPDAAIEIETMLAESLEGAERVARIVRDLLSFAREPGLARRSTDVLAAVNAAVKVGQMAFRHRARLSLRFDGSIPSVDGDEARLAQVFLNLLLNATQAFDTDAIDRNEVVVSARMEDGLVVVDVEDNGSGIQDADLERVFDPFFTTKPPGAGTGLGLAVSRSIVDSLGGDIRAFARDGGGSRVRVRLLPWANPPEAQPIDAGGGDRKDPPRGRVLVIDDEVLLARALGVWLEERHEVTIHTHAGAALEAMLTGHTFDMVLCDQLMPGVGGTELYRQICARRPEYASRFVFMTGGAVSESVDEGGVLTLYKPLDLAAVERVIAQRVHADRGRARPSSGDAASDEPHGSRRPATDQPP